MVELKIGLNLVFQSPYHSTSDRVSLEADKVLFKEDEYIIIPATLLKGNLRYQIEMALKAFGVDVCSSRNPESMCGKCIICKTFGSPRNKSRLFFNDVRLKVEKDQIQKRFGVGIYRKAKIVKEANLFSTEIIFFDKKAFAEIKGFLNSSSEAIKIASLFFLGMKLAFSIGAEKSRGLGWFKCEKIEAFVDGQPIKQNEIEEKIRELMP